MGILTSVFTGGAITASTPGPLDDFWYSSGGGAPSLSGTYVSPETALKLSAFYRGGDLLARALAAVPWVVMRNLPNEQGEERATDHPLYRRVHRRPNLWQTSAEFRYFGQWRVILHGDFFARRDVIRGDEVLTPLDPTRMDVSLLDTGRRGYLFKPERGAPERYVQDEMFHVMGNPRRDGVRGVSVIERARTALGRSLAQQEFGARWFSQNGTPAYALKHPAKLSDTARKNIEQSIQSRAAGLTNAHKAFVLEEGMDVAKLGLSLRDSQFVELDAFGVLDVCRWLGVQPHKVYELSRATFGNIEHQAIEFLTDTMDPWYVFWEQAAARDLLDPDDDAHSVKFIREGLLRGDLLSRAQAYATFIQNGVMAENEAREREGLKKFPGLDTPTRSANQDRGGDPQGPRPGNAPRRAEPAPARDDEDDDAEARAATDARVYALALHDAERVVRKEVKAIRQWHARLESDPAAWRAKVAQFYGDHVTTLTEELLIDAIEARKYGAEHCAAVLAQGLAVVETWERDAPAVLAAMALGE